MNRTFHFLPAAAVAVLGVALSFLTLSNLNDRAREGHLEYFLEAAEDRLSAVEINIASEIQTLKSIVGFFEGSTNVERYEFRNFTDIVAQRNMERSFLALEWVPRVNRADRQEFEASVQKDGIAGFSIRERDKDGNLVPAGERETYFPVQYAEPMKENLTAIGFDLASNPTQLRALEKARDTGGIVTSGRIDIVQTAHNSTGVLVIAPAYSNHSANNNMEDRQRNLRGYAVGVVRVSSLVSGIYESASFAKAEGIDLYLYDEAAGSVAELLYIHNSRKRSSSAPVLTAYEARSGINLERSFMIGDRTWSLIARPVDQEVGYTIPIQNWLVLITCLFLTAGGTVYMAGSATRTKRIRDLVEQRTAEIRDRESFLDSLVVSAVTGIVTIDDRGIVKSFNPAAEKMFGYAESEVIGNNVSMLMPDPYASSHDQYLSRYLETGEKKIIGNGRQVFALRKDGSTFPIDLGVSEFSVSGNRMFTGLIRDITESVRAEEELKASEIRFRSMVENAGDAIYIHDR
ncbi:MAG: CHASE domain-containing protein, partial [Rhodospirillales bacterium]|nr:CHASE domain-containing protein [Rhodospirillales bacterium]